MHIQCMFVYKFSHIHWMFDIFTGNFVNSTQTYLKILFLIVIVFISVAPLLLVLHLSNRSEIHSGPRVHSFHLFLNFVLEFLDLNWNQKCLSKQGKTRNNNILQFLGIKICTNTEKLGVWYYMWLTFGRYKNMLHVYPPLHHRFGLAPVQSLLGGCTTVLMFLEPPKRGHTEEQHKTIPSIPLRGKKTQP